LYLLSNLTDFVFIYFLQFLVCTSCPTLLNKNKLNQHATPRDSVVATRC